MGKLSKVQLRKELRREIEARKEAQAEAWNLTMEMIELQADLLEIGVDISVYPYRVSVDAQPKQHAA